MSSFTVGATVTTFTAVIRGSNQDSLEPETLTYTAYWATDDEWNDATNLMTQKYHVHQPLGGDAVVIDVARGAGAGTLVITNVGTTSAILVGLRATEYTPGVTGARVGVMTFIRTAAWS